MQLTTIALAQLRNHPSNSNVMPPPLVKKLAAHIERSDQYPPLIVRPHAGAYQIIDGHHRAAALRSLGRTDARCVVWDVDDQQTLVLLATLNRLQGRDDAHKRAALVSKLRGRMTVDDLARLLPEDQPHIEKLMRLDAPPAVRPPRDMDDMPVSVHFFLLPAERDRLEVCLRRVDASREAALMKLIDASAA